VLLAEVESWSELDWSGLRTVLDKLPPIRERVRDMSHLLSDCWTQLDNTQRLLSTLTEVKHNIIHRHTQGSHITVFLDCLHTFSERKPHILSTLHTNLKTLTQLAKPLNSPAK